MADIFISYSKKDPEPTKALATALEALGYTTWWDTRLLPGEKFWPVIQENLDAAKAVIVIWTENSAKSGPVQDEARRADTQNKLITVHTAGFNIATLSMPFDQRHSVLVTNHKDIYAAVERLCGAKTKHESHNKSAISSSYQPAFSNDPRGFPRGKPGNRDYEAPQQPRPEWEDNYRTAPPASPRNMAPTADPFPRTPPQSRNPYSSAPSTPYAPASSQRGYDNNDWRRQDPYQDLGANAFPSYYPPHDEPAADGNVQSMHDRFFAPEPEPDQAPLPAQNPPQSRDPYSSAPGTPYAPASSQRGYDNNDWRRQDPYQDLGANAFPSYYPPHDEPAADGNVRSMHDRFFALEPEPDQAPLPAQNRFRGSFDDHDNDEVSAPTCAIAATSPTWDKFDQAPPPASASLLEPPASVSDEDPDLDSFADGNNYEAEDADPRHELILGKRMVALLIAFAVATGLLAAIDSLAFLYNR